MIRKFKKHLALLFTGSFTMVLAACYGIPIDLENDISVRTVNEQNEAIKGLKVTMTINGERLYEDFTDDEGLVEYPFLDDNDEEDYQIKVEDIDGNDNGGKFFTEVVDIFNYKSYYTVNMNKE